jgi:hypothetical protein
LSNPDTTVTLKINRPRQPILVVGLLLFFLLSVVAELVARTDFVQDRIPYQAYGMNHTQLELQLNILDKFVAENGPPDCFIFGSSQAFREIDPGVFASSFNRSGGEKLNCYNFGITGSQIWTTSLLGQILIRQYQPRLVIIGTSFLDYTEGREYQIDERFKQNDWLEYRNGKFTIGGWLTANSYAWRTITILSYSAPSSLRYRAVLREAHKWDGEIAKSGFALSTRNIDPDQPVEEGFVKNLQLEFGNFGISERNLAALQELIAFGQEQGAQVLLVEMAYHPALLDLKNPRGNPRANRELTLDFINRVNTRLTDIASQYKINLLRYNPSLEIPETGWFDLYHLNRNGARKFSQWLGIQAAQFIQLLPVATPTSGGN